MMRTVLPLAALVLLLAVPARADQRELYTSLELSPSILLLDDTLDGRSHASQVAAGGGILVYYGLTNTVHVGLAARALWTPNVQFPGKQYALTDGSSPSGSLFEDVLGFGGALVGAYRFDTGLPIAPVFRLELGGTYLRYNHLQFIADNTQVSFSFPALSELVFGAKAVLAVEYRFGNHFVASLGVGARKNFNSLNTWQFELPITVGWIW